MAYVDVISASSVDAVFREVAASMILPHYRVGQPNERIDTDVEEKLSARLMAILPGSSVVGEEGETATHTLTTSIADRPDPQWVIDPIDGSRNFVAGDGPFVMMAALVVDGLTRLSVIHDPLGGASAVAERDGGTMIDGHPPEINRGVSTAGDLVGLVPLQYLPDVLKSRARRGVERIGRVLPGHHCVGREYWDLLMGRQDFAMFWQLRPWDHMPGQLLVREAGMVARRFDGSVFDHFDGTRGLVVARTEQVFAQVQAALLV